MSSSRKVGCLSCGGVVATSESNSRSGEGDGREETPLPGVTVQLKGFSVGTATNGAGMYQLSIPNASEKFSLVFSFVGMISQEVVYAGKDTINVVMKEDVETLEDVVVTGYMTLDKSKYVGAVDKVYAKDIMVPVRVRSIKCCGGDSGDVRADYFRYGRIDA